ncbi:DL-endopeptidase inhibitor IseA family protein [Paenibacillus radicis (ex Xue et al. 2023)]|nr:DL-endopeptidase inhibitor IseA family protein [Paenibacillus radicis (ex Xue et al. 2023)]
MKNDPYVWHPRPLHNSKELITIKLNMKSFVSGIMVGSVLFSGISYAGPGIVKLMVNGVEIKSEVPAQIIDGSTLVPARALAEALGAKVSWDAAHQLVIVEKQSHLDFSEVDMLQLAVNARNHYWDISNGLLINGHVIDGRLVNDRDPNPDKQSDGQPIATFMVNGKDYRWLSGSLDTKAKYSAYLEEVYTPMQVAAFIEKQIGSGSLVEKDGKLAQPNADGGSLLSWENSTVKLIQNDTKQKTFKFSVPLGDGTSGEAPSEKDIKISFIEGKGWRIDELFGTIR